MLRIVPTVSRFTSPGLLGKVAASTHTPRTSRRTFASTSARGVDVTDNGKEVDHHLVTASQLIQASNRATEAINSRLDVAESTYWLARQHELMDMTRDLGSPHFFFTLSRVQWTELYKYMPQIRGWTEGQSLHFFFNRFLMPLFGVVHFWYRYELQGGVGLRGFLWLKGAPNIDEINWERLKKDGTIPEDQEQKMRRFIDYWASILFSHKDAGDRPGCKPRETQNSTKEELTDLVNWIRRSALQEFSGRKLARIMRPRFDYPETVHAVTRVGIDSMGRVPPRLSGRFLESYASIMRLANISMKPIMDEKALRRCVTTKAEINSFASFEIPKWLAKSMARSADSTSQKMLDELLRGEWDHSAQESTHVLRGVPHARCSVSFETLDLGSGGYREPRSQEPDEGEKIGGVDVQEDPLVTDDSLLQRYMKRPPEMEGLSIYDVMTRYTWMEREWRKRENTTHVVLRVFPRLSPNPKDAQYDEYCRTKIILHHPFRNLATLLEHEDQSWAELYTRYRTANHEHPKDTLRCWEEENRETLIEEEGDKGLEKPDKKYLSHPIRSNTPDFIGMDDDSDMRWEHIDQMSTWLFSLKEKETFHRQDDPLNVNIDTLTQEQRKVLDVFTGTYTKILAGESPPQFLLNIDGTAGSGKTYLIRAICQELRRMARENGQRDPIRAVAPTGIAALNISGRTLQSAFSMRIELDNEFIWLTGQHLAKYRQQWNGVHFVILDEKSMIGARGLAQLDWRSHQLFPEKADKPFSNLNIALVGDFAQLPPVNDSPLYAPPSATASHGSVLYGLFKESYCLQTVHRQSGDSPEQVQFRDLLRHASEGNLSEDDWRTLSTRNDNRLSPAVQAQFKDALYLSATWNETEFANLSHLYSLTGRHAWIMAKHEGGASKVGANRAGGLKPSLVLAKGAKVMLVRNVWQESGLINTTTGVLEDIIWASGTPRYELPIAALVSFPTYTGPTLWHTEPREGFPKGIPILPIVPYRVTLENNGQTMSRTQLPLRLAWAATLGKAQGLTLSKIRLGLGEKKISTDDLYFALSRVKSLDDIMLVEHNDLAQVKELEGSQPRDRLEDFARRYPGLICSTVPAAAQ